MVARRLGLPVLVVVCVVTGVFGLTAAPVFAFQTHEFEESFGPGGTSATHFEEPASVAIDQSTGSIYVGDRFFEGTVQKFNSTHEPEPFTGISASIVEGRLTGFGDAPFPDQIAVNAVSHDLYFGSGGSGVRAYNANGEPVDFTGGPGAGTNEIPGSQVCGVALDTSGDIYVSEWSSGLRVYTADGEPITAISTSGLCQVAVDSHGTIYLTGAPNPAFSEETGPVQKFMPSEFPVGSSTTYEAMGTLDGVPSFTVVVDPSNDHVYADEGGQVAEYDREGTRLGAFGSTAPGKLPIPGNVAGLAINGVTGQVYVAQGNFKAQAAQGNFEGQAEVFGPAVVVPDVMTGAATEIDPKGAVTLNGTVNPDGVEVTECVFEYGATTAYGNTAECAQTVGSVNEEVPVSAHVSGLEPGVTYHFRLKAANHNGGHEGEDAKFTTPPRPAINATSATNLTATSVDLDAQINPGGLETTCRFQYGTSTEYATTVPCDPTTIEGSANQTVKQHIEHLNPNITYHWRMVATNEAGTTISVDHTFVYDTTGEGLPDNRAYEMVTPPHKNAALIGPSLGIPLDLSEDGSRLMVPAVQCFAETESCVANHGSIGALFLFSRTSGGWLTTPMAPSASEFEASSYWTVSAEAGTALFSMSTPPMLEDDFYARRADGSFVDIGPGTPPSGGAQSVRWAGSTIVASSDLSRVVYQESGSLWSFAEGAGRTPYEFSGTGNAAPVLVGVTGGPGSTDLVSGCNTALGSGGDTGNGVNAGVMSADGETVYFTAEACASGGTGANAGSPVPVNELYGRISGARTVAISEPQALVASVRKECVSAECIENTERPSSPAVNPNWLDASFAGASDDGSKAFFTSSQQLTDEASQASGNLYEYDFGGASGGGLVDVSAGGASGELPGVQGVVAVSSDGSHVYFVAQGVLTATANAQGEVAQDGANNLYVFGREGSDAQGHIAFVARLPETDREIMWSKNGESGVANVTPDGRFLVFESHANLTPDVTRTDGATQIFRYDALTGGLVRVSVGAHGFADNGNLGVGDAEIVPASRGWFHAGAARSDPTMSHDGSFIFFQSPIGLTPRALNDVQVAVRNGEPIYAENVYEWHEGQVYLISDGRDTNSVLLKACNRSFSTVCLIGSDATGKNVFFTTADVLLSEDTDTQLDYYDARICTSAEPCVSQPTQALPPCLGEACHGTPAAQVGSPSAGTMAFNGQGNMSESSTKRVKAKNGGKRKRVVKCGKGKRRVHGRCAKAKAKRGQSRNVKPHKGGK